MLNNRRGLKYSTELIRRIFKSKLKLLACCELVIMRVIYGNNFIVNRIYTGLTTPENVGSANPSRFKLAATCPSTENITTSSNHHLPSAFRLEVFAYDICNEIIS